MSAVSGSLDVIEEFYGETLSRKLVPFIMQTPGNQLLELADRVSRRKSQLEKELRLRRYAAESDIGPGTALPQAMTLHDDFYWEPSSGPRGYDSPTFKYWYLLSENLVMPDYIFTWAHEVLSNADHSVNVYRVQPEPHSMDHLLSAALYRLCRLRPLVMAGGIVLFPSHETLLPQYGDDDNENYGPLEFVTQAEYTALCEDPLIARTVIDKMNLMPDWEKAVLELDHPDDFIDLADRIIAEHGLKFADIWTPAGLPGEYDFRPIGLAMLHREHSIRPATNSALNRGYLIRSSAAALSDEPRIAFDETPDAAVTFGVPDLSTVSIEDVARLRSQEDVYLLCRSALRDLAAAVADADTGSFAATQSVTRSLAEDIVRPHYEQLSQRSRRLRIAGTVAGLAAGGTVGILLNGIATWIAGPAGLATRSASGMAAAKVRENVSYKISRPRDTVDIARDLLVSTLDQSVDEGSWLEHGLTSS